MVSVLRPGQRIHHIPAIGVQTSRRAVASGANGLLANLVAYWPMNEAAGANNALDLHINALTLTQANSPGSAAGLVYVGARTGNGTTQYFSRASETLLQTGDVDFTLAVWVYLTSSAASAWMIAKDDTSLSREYRLGYHQPVGAWRIYGFQSSGAIAFSSIGTAPLVNTWQLVIGSYSAVSQSAFISADNSVPVETARSAAPATGPSVFCLAIQGLTSGAPVFFPGRIGPVAMWKSAAGGGGVLSSAQRLALYNGGAGLPYASFTV